MSNKEKWIVYKLLSNNNRKLCLAKEIRLFFRTIDENQRDPSIILRVFPWNQSQRIISWIIGIFYRRILPKLMIKITSLINIKKTCHSTGNNRPRWTQSKKSYNSVLVFPSLYENSFLIILKIDWDRTHPFLQIFISKLSLGEYDNKKYPNEKWKISLMLKKYWNFF